MNARIFAATLVVCFWSVFSCPKPAESQESKIQALENYVGVWDCEFTIEPKSESDQAKRIQGTVRGKWVVGKQFVEQTGTYRLDGDKEPMTIRTMMSYDKANDRFHFVYFTSNGEIQNSHGKWDRDAKTMTSKMIDSNPDHVTTIVADFSDAGSEHWTIETKSRDGEILSKIVGTNTRRKNKNDVDR